jgi:transcriptional regulator with XRE-family HTH domain
MNRQFGEKIRTLREKQHLYLRQVAPSLEMNKIQLIKAERGFRQIMLGWTIIIANLLEASRVDLISLWKQNTFMYFERLRIDSRISKSKMS